MSAFRDDLGIRLWVVIALVFACVGAFVGIVSGIVLTVDSRNCAYASRRYDRPPRWDLFAGCYIQTRAGGQWVALDKYRVFLEDK